MHIGKGKNHSITMMFPDSDIAQKYQMGKAKLAYVINFGLEPYFRNMLI